MKALLLTFFILTVGTVALTACNSVDTYPAVGQVVYCPSCDRDLYLRTSGTSRSAFRRSDYTPLYFDMDLPTVGAEAMCPFCKSLIASFDANGYVERVCYRNYRPVED